MATLTVTKVAVLAVVAAVCHLQLTVPYVAVALLVDAVSHFWADRRYTLAWLADLLGKGDYYRLGAPRPGWNDNVTTGTGAYHLDQSWHVAWLGVGALIISVG
ncbi:hypothetical protein AAH991_38110 [Microbispora sp. ZYX-F-249]|uniref:DUF3307 domain-containing protein n=1 Tax=Microbispora maris TaxID=3144104 RepID=A0ABV0B2E1_9ACTN